MVAIISLLDQISYGEVTVYTTAIIAIAVIPYLEPYISLIIYLSVHTIFIMCLILFYNTNQLLFGHIINTSAFIIVSWSISKILYKNRVKEFNDIYGHQAGG